MPDMEEKPVFFLVNTLQLGMVSPGCYQLFLGASQVFCACWCLPVPELRKGGVERDFKTCSRCDKAPLCPGS